MNFDMVVYVLLVVAVGAGVPGLLNKFKNKFGEWLEKRGLGFTGMAGVNWALAFSTALAVIAMLIVGAIDPSKLPSNSQEWVGLATSVFAVGQLVYRRWQKLEAEGLPGLSE